MCHNLKKYSHKYIERMHFKSKSSEVTNIITDFIHYVFCSFLLLVPCVLNPAMNQTLCTLATQKVELPKQAKQSSFPLSGLRKYLIIYEKQSSSNRGSY